MFCKIITALFGIFPGFFFFGFFRLSVAAFFSVTVETRNFFALRVVCGVFAIEARRHFFFFSSAPASKKGVRSEEGLRAGDCVWESSREETDTQ